MICSQAQCLLVLKSISHSRREDRQKGAEDMRLIEREPRGVMMPGNDLVAAGFAGREGARLIARAREEELLGWFSRDYIRRIQEEDCFTMDHKSPPWRKYGALEWEEVSEGGILTALWNLSGAYMLGFEIHLHQIPVKQETIEVCERYDLNPYRLYSKNCVIAAAENGGDLVRRLCEAGIPSAVIGMVSQGIRREIRYSQVRGYLERPREDELYKILAKEFPLTAT